MTLFLSIMIPVVVFGAGIIVTLFANNNKSHGAIWEKINKHNGDITNRLTKIETKFEILINGKPNKEQI